MACLPDADQTGERARARARAAAMACSGGSAPLVAMLHTELTTRGWRPSQRTIRRPLHRLGWVWKRRRFVLGRPDPEYEAKKGRWQSKPARR